MKIFFSIGFLFCSLSGFAACEEFSGYTIKANLCWDDKYKGFKTSVKSDVHKFLKELPSPKNNLNLTGSKNPASATCGQHDLRVVVLRDKTGSEQSFCQFQDDSLLSAAIVQKVTK